MANIYCTKKLEKIIGKDNIKSTPAENLLGNWNANIFYINRKKFIFLINDKTCYSLIVPNFVKKDLPNFKNIFFKRLFDQFIYDGIEISYELMEKIYKLPIQFMKTNNNRKIIGTMTQFLKDLDHILYYSEEPMNLLELNHKFTDYLVSALSDNKNSYSIPLKLMKELILEIEGKI